RSPGTLHCFPTRRSSDLQQKCGTALALIAVAGFTDGLDGLIARRFNWQTRLGAYLDPVADKLLLTAVYVSLAFADLAPGWLVWRSEEHTSELQSPDHLVC